MLYKTYQDLNQDIKKNLWKMPPCDLIVGVPRSGMIPAYMLSFLTNIPVCSLDEFKANIFHVHSHRVLNIKDVHTVLVLDDCSSSGNSIREAREALSEQIKKYQIHFWAFYLMPGAEDKVDGFFEYASVPRMFQWNYLNHPEITRACFDIDGVLCYDPTPEENDDGEKYRHFILNAKPLFIPKYKIKALVTSRLEKYRPETEEWLKKHEVQYEKLYMLDLPSREERLKQNAHAKFKAKIYKKLNSPFFYESEIEQAREIFALTGKPVFCVSTDELIQSKEQAENKVLVCPKDEENKRRFRLFGVTLFSVSHKNTQSPIEKEYKCRIRLLGVTLFSKRKKGDKRIYRVLGIKFVLHKKKKPAK